MEKHVLTKKSQLTKKPLAWVDELKPFFKGKTLSDEEIQKAMGDYFLAKQKRINGDYSK